MHPSAWGTINLYWTNLIFAFDSWIQRSWSWYVSNIELLNVFPVVLCFCRCVVVTGFDLGCRLALVFLCPLWSLKLFRMAKEPFQKRSLELNSYIHVVVRDCDNFLIACYVSTTGPKTNHHHLATHWMKPIFSQKHLLRQRFNNLIST